MNTECLSQIPVDKEGYLLRLEDWNESIATELARSLQLQLTDEHWAMIRLIRDFYTEFDHSPAMRPFIKYIGLKANNKQAKSIYLMQLFPGEGSPVKRIALLAGLPKPDNCL